MSQQRVPLSPTELAYAAMVQEEFETAEAVNTQRRQQRLAVLFRDKGVPDGTSVTVDGGVLSYAAPDEPNAAPNDAPNDAPLQADETVP